ncbi:hypothetical protein LF887_14665 [Chryseobacterium sp. MEBOG06]|uniref:hypothetical protein n=1 Tax=unclassified Chryseobacterium TaxID=2593645 RepID=UPI001F2E4A34|nr:MULTISPECIES: hypothetical protein [unclassified Chryseobacterium]UKB82247.1 hypothetical protein LF887_14665 [Chryseobacterium sp. MEBOG06]
MKKTILLSAMFLGSLVFAQKAQVVGGDRDAHGCIGSAGYTYSQIKKDCVRVFEQKIKLTEVAPKGSSTSMAAVIFSKDKNKAEVFVKDTGAGSIILTRAGGKAKAWKNGDYILVPYKKNGYQLKKDNVVIYR